MCIRDRLGLSALLDERFGSGESPDFSALNTLVKHVGGAIERGRPSSGGESVIAGDTEVGLTSASPGQAGQLASCLLYTSRCV